jgi:hypothetical protein
MTAGRVAATPEGCGLIRSSVNFVAWATSTLFLAAEIAGFDKQVALSELFSAFLPLTVVCIPGTPGLFPDDFLAYSGRLLYVLTMTAPLIKFTDDFLAEIFKSILVAVQLPRDDLTSREVPSEAVAAMAFYRTDESDISLPRAMARGLFLRLFASRLDLVTAWLPQCECSEGLIHLIYSFSGAELSAEFAPSACEVLGRAFQSVGEMSPLEALSFLRTMARYVDVLPAEAVAFVRESTTDLIVNSCTDGLCESVPFTIGVEMLVDFMERGCECTEAEAGVLVVFAESAIHPVGLKALRRIAASGEASGAILQRCCSKLLGLMSSPGELLPEECALDLVIEMLTHIQRQGVSIPWDTMASLVSALAERMPEISSEHVYHVAEGLVCCSDDEAPEFGEFFVGQVLPESWSWHAYEDDIARILLCFAVNHPARMAPLAPPVFDRLVRILGGSALPIESLAAIVRLIGGMI